MAGNLFLSGVFGSGTANTGVVVREALSIGSLFSGAKLRIYGNTQATNADTATSGQTLLAELTFHATTPLVWSHTISGTTPSITGTASAGTSNAITDDSSADATGTATWFRIVDSGATKTILDGNVSTSGANLNLNSTSITSGATVSITSFTFTIPAYNAT